ncbi:bifunctional 2-polyprenyl-6-hydroxyphenol methylase/3-demethylubiquinol 3-O-methyltransferase UbiG [Okeania sp. SIO1I7]|uniref:class I SAM-dependent methyltransferase n=1 Tax=Okeania sp. SIO1I7 TaxID=2607772 RepID=UPI0013FA966C|nr:class I SAM-dependent methyltransferase [Okeania sp. SIO1I7]NET24746.1 class I SAM-dependent methyltransferase [Okeania sp. SIO1I7]
MINYLTNTGTNSVELNQEFLHIELEIQENAHYLLKGNIESSIPARNAALVTFQFSNKSGNLISPPYLEIPNSATVGPYKYIPINSDKKEQFLIAFQTPPESSHLTLGFRLWNSKKKVFIDNKIEVVKIKDEFELEAINNLFTNEIELAKNYWSNIGVSKGYTKAALWSHKISDEIISFNPSSVLEFGCNAGRNLKTLLEKDESIRNYLGLDINQDAINYGNSQGLEKLKVGDENSLIKIYSGAYDICFTVSVIDHIPQPLNVVLNLIRISKKACLLLEPFLGDNGKVIANYSVQKKNVLETTPYSYSWNYEQLLQAINIYEFLNKLNIKVKDFPLESNLGRYYRLWIIEKN